nr:immunoglobulin heavy chain junction region [Macaca mulatta]MOX58877.1 immunoglobulin heavy chain junction region [Macaca mulatta]MOX58880.1 immunoglobulin heavy chain junction region [Macaca mulatta]MOX58911.1 immunoglobulin heavy chain junction region [Macaca mulatta]MOX58928.1 immunoglobulin heavy chain junction region [Macaca mulatta]
CVRDAYGGGLDSW